LRALALGLGVLGVALGAAVLPLHLLVKEVTGDAVDYAAFNAAVAAAFSVAGAVIARRRPANPIGWALLAGGAGSGLAGCGAQLGLAAQWPLAYWLFNWAWIPAPVAIALTLHTFPDGQSVSPRWRPLTWSVVVGGVFFMLSQALAPRAAGDPAWYSGPPGNLMIPPWVGNAAAGLLLLLGAAGVISLALRWRRAGRDQRDQLKWLLLVAPALVATFSLFALNLPGKVWLSSAAVALFVIPLSVAILRHRLYDIDVIVSRALLYSALSGLVAIAYVVTTITLGEVFHGGALTPLSVIATVVAALVVLAARQRVQLALSRLLYGRRREPESIVLAVTRRLEGAGSPGEMLEAVAADLTEALKLEAVTISAPDGERLAGVEPDPRATVLALVHQGEVVGAIGLVPAIGDVLSAADVRRLAVVLPGLSAAIHAALLKRDLERSRERLSVALEDERRRIRHDLHDGLGPVLASIAARADAVSNLLLGQPGRAAELVAEMRRDAGAAITEVRRLVYGLRPPALDELGLVGAIRQRAEGFTADGSGLDVRVEAPESLPLMSAAVEVATYRIVTEAMTNAARHGHARTCRVTLQVDDCVEVEIGDDGGGWAGELRPGVGVLSMRERAASLGGTLSIALDPAGGVRVFARLPFATAQVTR
jgi:signal transduction histidine kinase